MCFIKRWICKIFKLDKIVVEYEKYAKEYEALKNHYEIGQPMLKEICADPISYVENALKESAGERQEELQAEDIINCVSNFYKVTKNDICGKRKNKEFVLPRQVSMYLILDMMALPQAKVGEFFGRDHATVIYARDKIDKQIKTDDKLATEINDIRKMLLKQ